MMNAVLEGTPDVGIPHKHIVRLLFLIVVLAAFSAAWAEVKLTKVAEYDIPKLGCGGIAYLVASMGSDPMDGKLLTTSAVL